VDELSETLKALSDPSRRRQLDRLASGAATSGQLAQLLTMSRPAGSQHLSVLAAAGLVHTTSAGRQRWHTLHPDRLYRARAWLDGLLQEWEATQPAESANPSRAAPPPPPLPDRPLPSTT
jgi:DNA-binding transcriptional ArsR family regulator